MHRTTKDLPPPGVRRAALYSHDTQGLGHIRRTIALAAALVAADPATNVLLLTGAPEATGLPLPERTEVLTLPALAKDDDGRYSSRVLDAPLADVLDLRAAVMTAALVSFRPDLLVVDKVARGVGGELDDVLRTVRDAGHLLLQLEPARDPGPRRDPRPGRRLGRGAVARRRRPGRRPRPLLPARHRRTGAAPAGDRRGPAAGRGRRPAPARGPRPRRGGPARRPPPRSSRGGPASRRRWGTRVHQGRPSVRPGPARSRPRRRGGPPGWPCPRSSRSTPGPGP